MKLLILPALLLALAAPAYAGISATFTVDTGRHWTFDEGRDFGFDDAVLQPFSGTVRSNLAPIQYRCSNSYRPTVHTSYCSFQEQSDWTSPYELEYLDRLENRDPMFRELNVILRISNDGSYRGYFAFQHSMDDMTEDAIGRVRDIVTTSYRFNFEGVGLAWDTTINAALAERLWQPQSMRGSYWSDWTRYRSNPLTGEESELEGDGWDGAINVAAVPEPAAPALFGVGLAAMAGLRRRKRS